MALRAGVARRRRALRRTVLACRLALRARLRGGGRLLGRRRCRLLLDGRGRRWLADRSGLCRVRRCRFAGRCGLRGPRRRRLVDGCHACWMRRRRPARCRRRWRLVLHGGRRPGTGGWRGAMLRRAFLFLLFYFLGRLRGRDATLCLCDSESTVSRFGLRRQRYHRRRGEQRAPGKRERFYRSHGSITPAMASGVDGAKATKSKTHRKSGNGCENNVFRAFRFRRAKTPGHKPPLQDSPAQCQFSSIASIRARLWQRGVLIPAGIERPRRRSWWAAPPTPPATMG